MSLGTEINETENIPTEEDIPLYEVSQKVVNNFTLDTNNTTNTKPVTKDVFNTVKGHNLLGWCVGLLVLIYLLELFVDKGEISKVGSDVVEIIKLLIFSLTGYLFGTNASENNR